MPELRSLLGEDGPEAVSDLALRLKPCREVVDLISGAIADDPPAALSDGEVIKRGFSQELDTLRDAGTNARAYLANLERQEKERTGIKSLRVGFNRVFGYYIEVSRSNAS